MHQEFTKDDFLISTDKQKLDFAVIHGFLSRESYWALNIPEEVVRRSIEGSLCFGVYHQERQVGFARLITDFATMAYLGDVFIVREYRGRGLSKWLVECITTLPELAGLRRWVLVTRDAHTLYEGVDFKSLEQPGNYMERRRP
jgi:GNAT superfamily N-acetyltransferase